MNTFILVPSDLETLQNRLSEDKNALSTIWKRINDKRLPAIPKSVLTVRNLIKRNSYEDKFSF